MPDGLLVLLFALEFEDDDLVSAVVPEDGGLDMATGDEVATFFEGRLGGELDFGADIAVHLFDADHVTGRNPVRMAKELATIDRLSAGRLLLVFVPGLTDRQENQALGVLTSLSALAGLLLWEHIWVQAGQAVPLS